MVEHFHGKEKVGGPIPPIGSRMIRIFRMFGILLLLAVIAAGIYMSFGRRGLVPSGNVPVQTVSAEPVNIPFLSAVLVQVDDSKDSRRIIFCNASGCVPKNPPVSVGSNPLSDGTNWYRYAEHTKGKTSSSVLEKVDEQGNVSTITEENPLVRPRAMIISTDGTKLAYFLDNIHDNSDLTELWVYDNSEGGTKVVAEQLQKKDIASRVRWNASSRTLWFLQQGKKEKQLMVASSSGGAATAHFGGISWDDHSQAADTGVMDINDDGSLIAFTEAPLPGLSRITVARNDEQSLQRYIKGNVVYIQWVDNGELLYAVQDGNNLSFWMANSTKEWPITRMAATFESAHSTGISGLLAFVASPRNGEQHLYVLHLGSGNIRDEVVVPHSNGKTYLVQTQTASVSESTAGINSVSDGALVAFIEKHVLDMTQDSKAKATRILMTKDTNTFFLDYTDGKGEDQRLLVSVADITHPEWKVIAKYTTINGIWKRQQESGDAEPTVTRLYEWEDTLAQWVLKQAY